MTVKDDVEFEQIELANIACDIAETTSEIGYVPRVELYEGMRRSIRWCAEQGIEL